jgi:beta-phosphoglucomutase-like phosphatase (HAD superfamily)
MTASSRIEAVAFDLDGLLVNTEELYQHVGTELLRRRGHSFEPDLLDASGIARGVATSSGPDFALDALGRMGIRDRFAFVLTSADVTQGKPNPEI